MFSVGKITRAVVVGIGATAVMDTTAEVLRRTRRTRSLDYALVGRWLGHMRHGQVRHPSIATAAPGAHERALGWSAHYAIGSGFAVALSVIAARWLDKPRLAPALVMGLTTVAAPWFVMQPAFGLGIAASRAPDPFQARVGSLRAHGAYGLGLWSSAVCLKHARPPVTP